MVNNQAQLQKFLDEASIRNTIARFADSATRADYASFRTVWADDGESIIVQAPHGQRAIGGDAIVAIRNHSVAFDRLRRLGDGWVFASRSFQYLWLDTPPFTGNAFPLFPDKDTAAAA